MKLTSYLRLVSRLVLCGCVPPLPNTFAWRDAQQPRTASLFLPLPLFLSCGRETWSVTLREEIDCVGELVLRRIFRPRREEVIGERRELHTKELHNLHSSFNIVKSIERRKRWARHVARQRGTRNA
jgi:hypothetical protein